MNRTIFFICSVFICCNVFSQTQMDNWVFGDSAGLNLTTGTAVGFHSKIRSHEACAAISDKKGALLFYTNGQSIWDKNNNLMPNGDSLRIGGVQYDNPSSLTQGVVIIPAPGDSSKYYVLYIDDPIPPDSGTVGLDYSVVNMNLNGGYGDVEIKNVRIFTNDLWEKMQATKHGNGQDWWILLHSNSTTDSASYFIRILVTPFGIEGPYFQLDTNTTLGITGQMKFSPDGTKLAFTRFDGNLSYYFFDRCTGILSHEIQINVSDDFGVYGCEFSPDGSKLYVTNMPSFGPVCLWQFCLNCVEPIEATMDTIYYNTIEDHNIGQIQLGSDGRIYIPIDNNVYAHHDFTIYNQYLSLINYPNLTGDLCGFDTLNIPLINARCTLALPNMPNYSLGPFAGSECDTLLAISDFVPPAIKIYPNPTSDQIIISGNATYANSNISLHVFNLLGEEVYYKKQVPFNASIALPELSNGLYDILLLNEKSVLYNGKLEIFK